MANTNVKSGAVVLSGAGAGAQSMQTKPAACTASVASAVTLDTFNDSSASFKDLNKSFVVRGAELEDSMYDVSVAGSPTKTKNKQQVTHKVALQNSKK